MVSHLMKLNTLVVYLSIGKWPLINKRSFSLKRTDAFLLLFHNRAEGRPHRVVVSK